jgi:GNAT superfamily N-acetyltransferase
MAEQKMQITADNEARRAHYSNLALIAHRKEEFVIDFLFVDPQAQGQKEGRALLTSRIVVNPGHMKRLYQAIGENIQRYEKNFGNIVLPPTLK